MFKKIIRYRNPSSKEQLFTYVILGFSFFKTTGLFALILASIRNLIYKIIYLTLSSTSQWWGLIKICVYNNPPKSHHFCNEVSHSAVLSPESITTINDLIMQLNHVITILSMYTNQHANFISIIEGINNGTELIYPSSAIPEFESNLILLESLINDLRSMADNLVSQIQSIDPNYSPPCY